MNARRAQTQQYDWKSSTGPATGILLLLAFLMILKPVHAKNFFEEVGGAVTDGAQKLNEEATKAAQKANEKATRAAAEANRRATEAAAKANEEATKAAAEENRKATEAIAEANRKAQRQQPRRTKRQQRSGRESIQASLVDLHLQTNKQPRHLLRQIPLLHRVSRTLRNRRRSFTPTLHGILRRLLKTPQPKQGGSDEV